jgi:hypothetical protein
VPPPELNYAKKGVFLPPKAGLPPLIDGSLFVDFLYKLLKRGLFWNDYRQKRGALSLKVHDMCKCIYLCCVRTDLQLIPVLSLHRSLVTKELHNVIRRNAISQFYIRAWGLFIYCNLQIFVFSSKSYNFFVFFLRF